ncbi:MAG: sensor domain-containing diguanylate cyclase [Xanthomonadales bacterium]|nr:sensor domain-containing diguanylate cyclase [Xanthomonadales bacterium]
MIAAPKPKDEQERLSALRALGLLDTPPEERFDRVTRLAKRLFDVPIALVSLVDEDRQWFKSNQGLSCSETPRSHSFCAHAILGDEDLLVPDTLEDERFAGNPLVVNEPQIRFYAGHPITTEDGIRLGTLCILDREPRNLDEEDLQLLRDLASVAEQEIQSREATMDELTDLSNRRGFIQLAERALATCRRFQRPASLLFFDLDGLKPINDQYGHAAGDRVLRAFADVLRNTFRDVDVVGRLGGDEFVVFMSGVGREHTDAALGRLAEAVDAFNQGQGSDQPERIHYSFGEVHDDPERHGTLADLMREADERMYKHKRARKSGR